MTTYLTSVGVGTSVGASFANLLISSECDYFVGILASNWNRLIDELKSTNGRMSAGYIALNADEWWHDVPCRLCRHDGSSFNNDPHNWLVHPRRHFCSHRWYAISDTHHLLFHRHNMWHRFLFDTLQLKFADFHKAIVGMNAFQKYNLRS